MKKSSADVTLYTVQYIVVGLTTFLIATIFMESLLAGLILSSILLFFAIIFILGLIYNELDNREGS